ncbi:MAG: nucleoside deaminase [Deltaproteobacteria bacterium]|nr:nucleoside deaminase [Deltaproteobacteria bacterium]MCB9478617.1 nucleoside deaminase [Deltaproteobacteria bacterium]MCB9490111.1 nucleoside deaminase [Deltaproteobacteria bacterium]
MVFDKPNDEGFMAQALAEAEKARALDEVPIGCVIVHEGKIVARAYNRREVDADPLAHAEVRAITEAAKALGRWRLTGCTLYVTLEPCVMCAGAIVLARLDRVVYGATDPKAGAVASLYEILADARLNHRPDVTGGVLAEECSRALSDFFRDKRQKA